MIAYYDCTRLGLAKEIEKVKEMALQALHMELKADPKINSRTWDTALACLTEECFNTAHDQRADM